MGNWWIDEAPWPGPDASNPDASFLETFQILKEAVIGATAAINALMKKEMDAIVSAFLSDSPSLEKPKTYEERRMHALKHRANLSTGPTLDRGYSRSGRKLR
jgi:hypothetical protein